MARVFYVCLFSVGVLYFCSTEETPEEISVNSDRMESHLQQKKKQIQKKMAGHLEPKKQTSRKLVCADGKCQGIQINFSSMEEETEEETEEEGPEEMERKEMTLHVTANNTKGRDVYVSSQLCPVLALIEAGETIEIGIESDCDIFLYMMDGGFRKYTEEIFVEYLPGDMRDLEFSFSNERIGGLGISIQKTEDGFEILDIYPDMPAEAAGLDVGDVLVEVNGISTYDLSVEDFQRLALGPEGTEVEFRLLEDDEQTPVRRCIRKATPL